jgi:hypothetical protein
MRKLIVVSPVFVEQHEPRVIFDSACWNVRVKDRGESLVSVRCHRSPATNCASLMGAKAATTAVEDILLCEVSLV